MKHIVLCDMSSIVKALAFSKENAEIASDLKMLREMVLNHLQRIHTKMKTLAKGQPELVLVYDMPKVWRKEVFPNYKWKDSDTIKETGINMENFYVNFNIIKHEYSNALPLVTVSVENAEADDVIAVVTRYETERGSNVSIVSNDEDFLQLRPLNVVQYKATKLTPVTADYDLFEHVCRGDRADGIPNILSDVDCFKNKVRQTTLRNTCVEKWRDNYTSPEMFCDNSAMYDRFITNRKLIDFKYIPQDIVSKVESVYMQSIANKPTGKVREYCNEHSLTTFLYSGGFQ